MYLLDNNAFREFQHDEPNTVARIVENGPNVLLSSVAAEELLTGVMSTINRSRSGRNSLSLPQAHDDLAQTLQDISLFAVFAYSKEAEAVFRTFPASTLRIGQQDCRIAAQALAHGMIVVTRNVRDFEAIGAPCEDWSR